jgi:hypothetical protein
LVPKVYATRKKPGALTTPSPSLGDVKRVKTSIPSEIKTAVRNAPFLKILTATQTFPIPFCAAREELPHFPRGCRTTWRFTMKRTCSALAIVLLSSAVALAQGGGGGGSGGSSGGSAGGSGGGAASSGSTSSGTTSTQSGTGNSTTPGGVTTGPNNTGGPVPGLSTPSASDSATTGRAPGVNPANPQDARRRGNPSDRTLPGAQNPQDMRGFDSGTPQIIAPERR